MNGFKAYKYYMAVKLHYTTDKFDVFKNGGKVKGSIDAFKKRGDRFMFDKLATTMPDDRKLIQYFVANFAYGNPNSVWDQDEAKENYKQWQKRKESIVYTFKSDCQAIINHCEKEGISLNNLYSFVDGDYPELLKLYVGKHITIETMRILEDYEKYLDEWKKNDSLSLLWDDERRRIEKSKGFVKYDKQRVQPIFENYRNELMEL
jgi:hypothetical protein